MATVLFVVLNAFSSVAPPRSLPLLRLFFLRPNAADSRASQQTRSRALSDGSVLPIHSLDECEAASVKIQSVFRGYYVRYRLYLAKQATNCVQAGVMFSFRDTVQVSAVCILVHYY